MGRFWSIVFLMVPVLGTLAFVFALADYGWFYRHWLPPNINEHGAIIDHLFMFILVLTGVIFIATGLVLFWFLWRYDGARNTQPVRYMHGSHTLEVVWSILPAATLLFIAIFQMESWASAKMVRPREADGSLSAPIVEVTGRQFEWRIRYPGADGRIGTRDDIHTVNDLHLPVGEELVVRIKSQDVLHSFFLPHLRVKQDVVPGMEQYVWFKANRTGIYDIVRAELCGWGHYKMRGRMTIESPEAFQEWLAAQRDEQNRTTPEPENPEE